MKRVGQYDIQCEIGSGQFGVVYKALDTETGTDVAMKVLSSKKFTDRLVCRLTQEIDALSALDHPNILKLHKVLKTSNNIYIVTEYCGGGNLAQFRDQSGRAPEQILRNWTRQLVEAFQVLQSNRVMHRDVKPANLLLNEDASCVKLADFGFAKLLVDSSMTSTWLGTPLYMAPEVLRRRSYGGKADVWSLGVVLFELAFGQTPFRCQNLEDLRVKQKRPVIFPSGNPTLNSFLSRMLCFSPEDRGDWNELAAHPFLQGPEEAQAERPVAANFSAIRREKIDAVCLTIEQHCESIDEYMSIYEEMVANEAGLAALGIAAYVRSRVREAYNYSEKCKSEFQIIESTSEHFAHLYDRIQFIILQCISIFEAIQQKYGSLYAYIFPGQPVQSLGVELSSEGIVAEHLRTELGKLIKARAGSLSLRESSVLRKSVLILTAAVEINPSDQEAQEMLAQATESYESVIVQ